ncbi:MAG: AI-2E family transporter [Flavobacteriaceae bacterium]
MADSKSKPERGSEALSTAQLVRYLLVAVGIAAVAALLWHLKSAALFAFAAVLVAIVLLASAGLLRRSVPLPQKAALVLSGLMIAALVAAVAWFGWPTIKNQSLDLLQQLPDSLSELEMRTGIPVPGSMEELQGALGDTFGSIVGDVANALRMTATGLTGFIFILIAGAYLAADPELYRNGFVALFPKRQQLRTRRALDRTGAALGRWLTGQLLSMTIVGVLVGLGAYILGLPAPLALALFAFLTEFVPLFGAIVGAVPGLLVALGEGWNTLFWAAGLYIAVQQIESNIITPIVQEEMVKVPAALFMISVVAMGTLFGILGVLLSGPLTVAVFVLVRTLYVEDALGNGLADEQDGKG